MVPIRTKSHKGLTAIELLIIASILAVIAVFATPIISDAVLPSDLKEGIEITESSVKQARQTARLYKMEVLMQVGEEDAQERQVLTLFIPGLQRTVALNQVEVKYILPVGIRVVSQEQVIHFKPDGEVDRPHETLTILDQVQNKSHQLALVD
jgi:Tfp pilus assembly protein FimT